MFVFEGIFRALEARAVRYVVVGGLAVIIHGHLRVTGDLDLIVDFEPSQLRSAVDALTEEGLSPLVPVDPRQVADPETRRRWIEEKHMLVFQMRDLADMRRQVDIFVEHPIPFEDLWARSCEVQYGETKIRVASIEDLITLKRIAGRPIDLQDIHALQQIERGRHER